jgi:CheY-like chemotaxis protein
MAGGGAFDVIRRIKGRKALRSTPVVATSRAELDTRQERRLRQYADSMPLSVPQTDQAMLDQVALFLHRPSTEPAGNLRMARSSGEAESGLSGRRILIVDDDVRNVFALTSALEQQGIDVVYAESGEAGLDTLRRDPEIDLVLMDVMMPGMDGYTAMRAIRKIPSFRDLPVIALTAKAMPGDRDNSLTAGASDYVTKPVDVEQLLSVLRSWLS